jgi:hypothetical protein
VVVFEELMAAPARWFPTVSNGITLPLQTIFQRVLTYVYGNQTNIANLQTAVAAIPSPSSTFPLHWNSLGTPPQSAYNQATGDQFFCYAQNKWVRLGPSGTSTTF